MRFLWMGFACFSLLVLVSCGGAASPDAGSISLSIMPASASVAAGSTLSLTGNATRFTKSPLVGWWMQEAKGSPGGLYCGFDTSHPVPSPADCPAGYITYDTSVSGVPSAAVYHAPSTPGTYHPVFQASQWDSYTLQVSKTTTAEITVTQ